MDFRKVEQQAKDDRTCFSLLVSIDIDRVRPVIAYRSFNRIPAAKKDTCHCTCKQICCFCLKGGADGRGAVPRVRNRTQQSAGAMFSAAGFAGVFVHVTEDRLAANSSVHFCHSQVRYTLLKNTQKAANTTSDGTYLLLMMPVGMTNIKL